MLLRIVVVLTIISALAGLVRVLMLSANKRKPGATDPLVIAKRRRQKLRGNIVLWLSVFALLFLATGYFTPLETILALALCLLTIYPMTFVKGELRFVQPEKGFIGSANARDAATGELLGTVVQQIKGSTDGVPTAYRIRTKDGMIVEKSAGEVIIELAS